MTSEPDGSVRITDCETICDIDGSVRAIKLGLQGFAKWFAVGAIQSIYAEADYKADVPMEQRRGSVKVTVAGREYGVIVAGFETMRVAQDVADAYAELVWGRPAQRVSTGDDL